MGDINQILLNPVRAKISKSLQGGRELTATEISTHLADIPRTTLYRHIQILLENKIIAVVKTEQVRGTIEKTFAIDTDTMRKADSVESAVKNIFSFVMNIYNDFEGYFGKPNADINRDMLFLRNSTLHMTDDECSEFVTEISTSIKKRLSNKPSIGRKARRISLISSPIED